MALPTLTKTWLFISNAVSSVNQAVGSLTSLLLAGQHAMFALKTTLTGFATGAWTVQRSSDSVSAGASDYWLASTNLIWNATTRSWIVLRNAAGAELLIDLNGASANLISVYFSPQAHFTGGAINARPTAADEQTIQSGASWAPSSAGWVAKLHVLASSDGYELRVLMAYNGNPTWMLAVGESKNPPSVWSNPYWAGALPFTQNDPGCAALTYLIDGTRFRGYVNSASVAFSVGGEACRLASMDWAANNQTFADEDTGEWPLFGMSLWSVTTSHRGRRGEIKDWWWGSITRTTPDTYPGDGSKQFVQWGDTVLPWNGTAMQMT